MLDLVMLGIATTAGTAAGIWLTAWAYYDAPSKAFAVVIGVLDFMLGMLAYTIWTDVANKLILS